MEWWEMWLFYVFVVLVLIATSYGIIKLYQEPREADQLTTVTSSSAIFFSLLCILTPPFDIYSLELSNASKISEAIRVIYFVLFVVMLVYSFGAVPFAYFYAKQRENGANVNMTVGEKACNALKKTLFFLFIVVFLLMTGVVVTLYRSKHHRGERWILPVLKLQTDVELTLRFVIGTVIILGFYLWITVAGRGLADVPLAGFLVYDTEEAEAEDMLMQEIEIESQTNQRTREAIESKYEMSNQRKLSKEDKQRLQDLFKREKLLQGRRKLTARGRSCMSSSFYRAGCLRIPIGIVLLLFSFSILVSMLLTSVDKLLHSSYQHGYVLDRPRIFNPIDFTLVHASKWFPMDYLMFAAVIAYVLATSLTVMSRYGAKCFCISLPPLCFRNSSPTSVLLAALSTCYIALVMLMALVTLAPQYTTFGHQTYYDAVSDLARPCTLAPWNTTMDDSEQCRMSQLSMVLNGYAGEFPFLGSAFYAGNWLFILSFIPWTVLTYCKSRSMDDVLYSPLIST